MKSFIKTMIIFMSIILGIFLGNLAETISGLKFLSYGMKLGFDNPVVLNLGFMKLTLGFLLNLNIAGILGFMLSIFIVKKVLK